MPPGSAMDPSTRHAKSDGGRSPNLDDAAFCCLSARKPCLDAVKLDGSAAL